MPRPFRAKLGCWYALCEPCRLIVHRYRRGGWCRIGELIRCDRCRWRRAKVEFYPKSKAA